MPAIFGATFRVTGAVMDRQKVLRAYETARHRALSRTGAVLRQEARKTIRRRVVSAAMRQRLATATDKKKAARIRSTIERRQATVSAPGEAPIAHVPDHPVASLRAIYFAVEINTVLVGPVKANQVTIAGGNRTTVPELLEFGGSATIHEERFAYINGQPGEWRRRDMRRSVRPWKRYRTRTATYAPRPFMNPTLQRSQAAIRRIVEAAFAGRSAA